MATPNRAQSCAVFGAGSVDLDRLARRLYRRYRTATAGSVADETGIPEGTVKNWLQRRCGPSTGHLIRLGAAYGPDFVADVVDGAPEWLSDAGRRAERARLEQQAAEIEARLAALKGAVS